jgi:hypothetical protein
MEPVSLAADAKSAELSGDRGTAIMLSSPRLANRSGQISERLSWRMMIESDLSCQAAIYPSWCKGK